MSGEIWSHYEVLREKELNSGLTKADIVRKFGFSRSSLDRAIKVHGINYGKFKLSLSRRRKAVQIPE